MSLAAAANLLVAASGLSVVRLIRGAMRAADAAAGRGLPASGLGPAPNAAIRPRQVIQPTPRYLPRPIIHPTPRYEPRQIIRTITYEIRREPLAGCDSPSPVLPKHPIEGPIPPVWKQLPPLENPAAIRRPVKVVRHHPDSRHKGIVVDLHI